MSPRLRALPPRDARRAQDAGADPVLDAVHPAEIEAHVRLCRHNSVPAACDEWECQHGAAFAMRAAITGGDCLALLGVCDGTCDGLGEPFGPAPTAEQRARAAAWPAMTDGERDAAYAEHARRRAPH